MSMPFEFEQDPWSREGEAEMQEFGSGEAEWQGEYGRLRPRPVALARPYRARPAPPMRPPGRPGWPARPRFTAFPVIPWGAWPPGDEPNAPSPDSSWPADGQEPFEGQGANALPPGDFDEPQSDSGRSRQEWEQEYESEVDRGNAVYWRWVQASLNRILGTRLALDGVIGTQTRTAIRTFQQRRGLTMDGNVDSRTEAMLVAAGAVPPPRQPGVASPAGTNSAIDTQLPSSGPGYQSYASPARQYGTAATIRALQAIGAMWQRRYPRGPRIGFGDISFRGGAPMPPHKSHRKGLDVDVRPMRNDGKETPVTCASPHYSRELTQELVNLIRANGMLPVAYIFFNGLGVTGVKRWEGHDNHLHVRFVDSGQTPQAARTPVPPAPTSSAMPAPSQAPSVPSAGGRKYTDSPNEVATARTTPAPRAVVDMLRSNWSALTDNGARTLTAQFMAETGGGKYCFNWNLGNVKAGANEPHMYLRNVWECYSPAGAEAQVAKGNGLVRIATADEVKQHGWKCPSATVVFDPPHPQCRFRAYASLQDGAQKWLGHHLRIAGGNPGYVTALNAGNIGAVAHALKNARYYSAGEADYARAMTRTKAQIDQALGPLR